MSKRNRRRRKKFPETPVECVIESMTTEGRGLVHIDSKPVFIDGALPAERVVFQYNNSTKKYAEGRVVEVIDASDDRVEPPCVHAEICGGCSLQHVIAEKQIEYKQTALIEALEYIGHVQADSILPPLTGPATGYRTKARLGVRYVQKKNRVLVGFREKRSNFLAEIDQCEVLHPKVGQRITALSELIYGMQARESIPQIEVACGDDTAQLVFRHLEPLIQTDKDKLIAFAKNHELDILLQPGGPDSVLPLWPEQPKPLSYHLPDQDLRYEFEPSDFTQVNTSINRQMINRALELLELDGSDQVLDLFCGLGNFTLPLAQQADYVVGIEGSQALVNKARKNAELNQIDNVIFHAVDLSDKLDGQSWLKSKYTKILLDPPRSGAMEMLNYLGKLGADRLVYISCQPTTLARDAGQLVNEYGYTLKAVGVMDMFPHTAHVESIAVFER